MAGEAFKLNRCIPLGLELQAVRADQRIPFFPGSSNTFLGLPRNLRLLFLLYWMKPVITPGTASLARAGVAAKLVTAIYENQIQTVSSSNVLRRGAGHWLLFQSVRNGGGFGGHCARENFHPVVAARRKGWRGLQRRRAGRHCHRRWRALALRFPTARRPGHARRFVADFDRHPAKRDGERPFPSCSSRRKEAHFNSKA